MHKQTNRPGFTIVELLVVIVVIGVLATLSIVSYVGISQRAKEASIQSDLAIASNQLKIAYTQNGQYPSTIRCDIGDDASNLCLKSSNGSSLAINAGGSEFCLSETNGGISYYVTQNSAPTVGVCPVYGDGADGAITLASSVNINTTNIASGRSCADGGDAVNYSVTSLASTSANLSVSPSAGCLKSGDEVMIINLQGVSGNYSNVGNYETIRISSVSGATVNFSRSKSYFYGNGVSDDTNIGTGLTNQRVMMQRVPNYTDVTINNGATLSASAWNSVKGGVLAFKANGNININGTISTSNSGFSGGTGGGGSGYYVGQNNSQAANGQGPSGITGSLIGGTGTSVCTPQLCGGAAGVSGGGGGGGGGHANSGSTGSNTPQTGIGGAGGGSYGLAALDKLYLGAGGAGGSGGTAYMCGSGSGGTGGFGGGIVFMMIKNLTISGTGSITSGGQNGTNGTNSCNSTYDGDGGGGGGGAGGSVRIYSYQTANSGTISALAGTMGNGATGSTRRGGNGGNGSAGRIAIYYDNTISGTTNPAAYTLQF